MDRSQIALAQGGFFGLSGLWPLVHMPSFSRATGGKSLQEQWLVRTVGALVTAVGGTLLSAGARKRITPEIKGLGIGAALALAGIDAVYVAKRRISPIYLLDAAAELGLVAAWTLAPPPRRRPTRWLRGTATPWRLALQ